MAYVSKEKKAKIVAAAKPILAKYGMKATFSVNHHSTIVCTIVSGKLEFAGHEEVNEYYLDRQFSGDKLQFMTELTEALNTDNYDNSDIQTDYFDVGHYVRINIGKYNKNYVFTP